MTGVPQRLKVKLKGGGPWGFRLLGGAGTGLPLTVAKIRRKSKSYKNLQEGDLFVSVNGIPCDSLTYDQVMTIADKSGTELNLEVERKASIIDTDVVEVKSRTESTSNLRPHAAFVKKTAEETKVEVTEKKTIDNNIVKNNTFDFGNDRILNKESNQILKEQTQNSLQTQQITEEKTNLKQEVFKSSEVTEDSSTKEKSNTIEAKSNIITNEETKTPEITSDIQTKTTSEITPTSEKCQKIQTEKIHEKLENGEKTIIRTDYEEIAKSHDATPCLTNSLLFKVEPIILTEQHALQSVTRESYEITKSEKTEVQTTTKVNGFTSFMEDTTYKGHEENRNLQEGTNILSGVPDASSAVSLETADSLPLWSSQFESTMTKKKKMFSSSSFYEEPQAIYPTVEEQVEMAKKIAESLADDTNKKSKGANMFFKRAKRSTKWVHEGPEPSGDSTPGTPDAGLEPFYPEYYVDGSQNRRNGPKLKLVLDPRHPIDVESLRSTGHNISEHNVISPDVCRGLAKDLESPVGKGSALFAKRKMKSSEWVVDEEKVKALMGAHDKNIQQMKADLSKTTNHNVNPYRASHETTLPQAYGRYDSSYNKVDPDKLAETVIQAAEYKRRDSIRSTEEMGFESCRSPIIPATPAATYYDIYKAKAPKGWSSPLVTGTPCFPTLSSSATLGPSKQSSLRPMTVSSMPQFQNFNTLPRKWKSPY